MKKNKNLLIAHYHKSGEIRDDLVNFIKESKKSFNKIIFISTKLKRIEHKKIYKYAKIISRPNYGYDFYSYKIGIKELFKNKKIKEKSIFFVASSIFFINPKKLIRIFNTTKNIDKKIFGLTKSWEIEEHLQTDIFSIPTSYFMNKKFYDWWKKIGKFKKRSTIIGKYELGFTKFLKRNNFNYDFWFKDNIHDYPDNYLKLIKKRIKTIFLKKIKIYKKNPTHFYWKSIFTKFGIIKIDLIKINPNKINMTNLKKILGKKKFKIFETEAQKN